MITRFSFQKAKIAFKFEKSKGLIAKFFQEEALAYKDFKQV